MISLPISETSQIGAARRRALQEAETIDLSSDDRDRLALVVTEAGTNLLRHATGGEILLSPHKSKTTAGMDVIALDDGPGLPNVEAAMADGFTTAEEGERSLGSGLGAIARMSDSLDIHSDSRGTTLTVTIGKTGRYSRGPMETAGLVIPKPGFEAGGDICGIRKDGGATMIMLMDVLGHGPTAAKDAETGLAAFLAAKGKSLEDTELHVADAMAGSRGAASLIVEMRHGGATLRALGVGNVKGEILAADGSRHGIPSAPGIVGASSRRPRATEHGWGKNALLILTTDGLKGGERFPEPSGLFFRDVLTVAATLYKRRRRGSDDCGVVIARARQ
ncbi:ATP-binding protein [Aurantimonas sp. A2-1-M11]|uniref:ATP-binding protein n=1 Tax=Aurantimonas sp. A2-1-M11 TaxID=3113712 RepID=UPI002F927B64